MTRLDAIKRTRKRVVIVDDSRTMQALLEQLLTVRLGFEIVGIAGDGRSALPMIRSLQPDLVTIDLQMPYIDGQQLLREMQDRPDIYKVVLSANASSNLAVKAHLEDLGADACISKMDMSRDPGAFCSALLAVVCRPKAHRKPRPADEGCTPRAASRTEQSRSTAIVGYPIPADERARLTALKALNLANDDVDHQLDLLTAHLGRTTSFAACAMTFIDRDTQWVKSGYGLDRGSGARAEAFCNHTICGTEPFIVPDAQADERFSKSPLVLAGMVRSYVGCPIIGSSGIKLGALCLVDSKPRRVTVAELTNLRGIARIAAELIETRAVRMRDAA